MPLKRYKETYNTIFWARKLGMSIAVGLETDRHTHRMTTVTLWCMRRGLIKLHPS